MILKWLAVIAVGLDGLGHMVGFELGIGHVALAYLQARDP